MNNNEFQSPEAIDFINLADNWQYLNDDKKNEIIANFNDIVDFNVGEKIINKVSNDFYNLSQKDKTIAVKALEEIGAQSKDLENYSTNLLLEIIEKDKDKQMSYRYAKSIDIKAIRLLLPLETKDQQLGNNEKKILIRIFEAEEGLINNISGSKEKNDIFYNFSKFGEIIELRQQTALFLSNEFAKSEKNSDLYYTLADNLINLPDQLGGNLLKELQVILKNNIKNNIDDTKCFKYLRQIYKIGDKTFIPIIQEIKNEYPFPGINKLSGIVIDQIQKKNK